MATAHNISVTALVDEVGSLPSVAAHVVALTSDPGCSMGDLARVILADAAMSLRFLALANSAAFSRGREVRDLRTSLVRLGLIRVRDLALLMGAHDLFPTSAEVPGLPAEAVWQHNLATACWSRVLGRGLADHAQDAWLAGILQGIGLGVLMQRTPVELGNAVAIAHDEKITLAAACQRSCGCHPWQVGAAVCDRWQLPRLLRNVVAHQADLVTDPPPPADAQPLIRVVRCAREMAAAQGLGASGEGVPAPPMAMVGERIGLAADALEAHAAKVSAEVDGLMFSLLGDRAEPSAAATDVRVPLARLGLAGVDASLARQDLQEQLDTAREIQQQLLPRDWNVPGPWTISAMNRPSCTVSGDIYDILPAANDRTAVAVADVSGKGVAAALLASNLQATLRALAPVTADLAELLGHINRQLCGATDDEHFATLFVLLLPADGGPVRYVSAGHVPPLVLGADGRQTRLRPGGPPVGMLPGTHYRVGEFALAPGDRVVVCTDGLTEAANEQGTEFGEEGLATAAKRTSDPDPELTLVGILEAVLAHADPVAGPADDLTLLVAGRTA